MAIIDRYLAKDLAKTLMVVLMVLLLIAMSNKSVSLLSRVNSGSISQGLLMSMIAFQIPDLLAFLLPLSLFLAILLSFGRAFADHEMTILLVSGMAWKRIIYLVLGFALVVGLISLTLNLYWVPNNHLQCAHKMATQEPGLMVDSLVQGRFYSFNNDQLVFYVNRLSSNKRELNEVFIVQQPDFALLTARQGEIKIHSPHAYLELKNGARYQGEPGKKNYQMVTFAFYKRLLEKQMPAAVFTHARCLSTLKLLQSTNKADRAELHRRLGGPLSTPILALLAVSMSRVSPRRGRYAKLIPAILFFIIYANTLEIGKRLLVSETLPMAMGLWWVHAIMLSIALMVNRQRL